MNLLNLRAFRGLLKSRWFPLVIQILLLVVFFILIGVGLGVGIDRDDLTVKDNMDYMKQLRNTNLANLIVWSYWFPLVIVSAILLGRVWCMVCPMELVTSLASKFGLKRKVPKFFKSGWIITIIYTVVLLVCVHTWSIHRIPHRMAIYLLVLLLIPLVVGLLFEKRAFCSYICPVGHLLGLYARISPLEWRSKDPAVCESCESKDCISKKKQYKIFGRSCTSNLYPGTIENNQDCLLCSQCLKVCPNDNLRFSIRKFYTEFFTKFKLNAAQLGFIILLSGFVIYEIMVEWSGKKVGSIGSKEVLLWLPKKVYTALGFNGTLWAPLIEAMILFVVLPTILFLLVIFLAKIKSKLKAGTIAMVFAMLLLPTISASHLNKGIFKMTSRIPYWEYTVNDPNGVETAQMIHDKKTIRLDKSIPKKLKPVTTVIAMLALLIALTGTLFILFKSESLREFNLSARLSLLFGVLIYWGIFGVMLYLWRLK